MQSAAVPAFSTQFPINFAALISAHDTQPCTCDMSAIDEYPNLDRKLHYTHEIRFEYFLLGKIHSAQLYGDSTQNDSAIITCYDHRCTNPCIVIEYYCANADKPVLHVIPVHAAMRDFPQQNRSIFSKLVQQCSQ